MTISYFAKFVAEISVDSPILVGRAVEGTQQRLLMTPLLLFGSFVYTYNCQFIFIFHLLMFPCFRCQITGMKHCTFIDRTREPPNRYQVFNYCNKIWILKVCSVLLRFVFWPWCSGVSWSGDNRRMDWQDLRGDTTGAHHHKRCVRQENADPKVSRPKVASQILNLST